MVQLHHEKDDLIAKKGRSLTASDRPKRKPFLVCHTTKFTAKAIKGLEKHIQRTMTTTINEDIEPSKTALNYDLSGFDKKTMNYSSEIQKRLDERFRGVRAIRSDAVLMVGVIISASSEFFEDRTPESEREYFQTALDYIAEKFGRENIISATVHKDEKTPHLHINFVPLTQDGRLSAKELLNREALKDLQENLPKALQDKGFEIQRGLPSRETRAKHKDPRQWKIEQTKNELERTKHHTEQLKQRSDERKQLSEQRAQSYLRNANTFERFKRVIGFGSGTGENQREQATINDFELEKRNRNVEKPTPDHQNHNPNTDRKNEPSGQIPMDSERNSVSNTNNSSTRHTRANDIAVELSRAFKAENAKVKAKQAKEKQSHSRNRGIGL